MSVFDLGSAALSLGITGDPLNAIGVYYGIPECLLSLGSDVLNVLPTPFLNEITRALNEGKDSAHEYISKLKKKILLENGIFELETETGRFRFISDSSKNKIDNNLDKKSSSFGDFLTAVGAAAQTGAELYANYVGAVETITGVQDCIDSYKRFLSYQKGPSNKISDNLSQYSVEIAQAQEAQEFIIQADKVLDDIGTIITERLKNPSLEPIFNDGLLPTSSTLPTSATSSEREKPIFRLSFGPPKSKHGQFLLSVDGLYYDSQTGGLPSVSGIVPSQEAYKFNFPANLGGKGDVITSKDLQFYVDTIFDSDIIDDSVEMQKHYDADHFLQVLLGQRNRNLFITSGQINSLLAAGYSTNSAMVENTRQQLLSVSHQHNNKINKRKKQIEIAIKAPTFFGADRYFNFGEVPVNDFSFLSKLNLNVAFEQQRKLTFRQGEVSGVVLPLRPKYVKASESQGPVVFNHLVVPPVGIGSILFTDPNTSGNILNLTDSIVTDGLIAVYNFFEADITYPGSTEFNVLNCTAKSNKQKAAQLVGKQASSIFVSGIGIPYLNGMVELNSNTGVASGSGNYIQIQDLPDFQNLLYNPRGATIETWMYLPGLTTSTTSFYAANGWSASGFHRLLLGCENTGGGNYNEDPNRLHVNYGSEFVRGLVCGFTRDRQITSDSNSSDTSSLNPVVASGIHFYLAPTRSLNSSDIGFLRDEITVDCAGSSIKTLKCSIPITSSVGGYYFSSIGTEFCQVAITIEPQFNQIKFYLDGNLMVTSALNEVFGINKFSTVRIPSFVQSNSLSYATSTLNLTDFRYGPTPSSFTPWIIGGGYSDGLPEGFMGLNSGRISGLNGFIGSLKFYSKPLNNNEVLTNYTNQQAFFKNIVT